MYARTKWSALAFEEEYGELGLYGKNSLDLPRIRSPKTSSVETWISFIFFLYSKIDSSKLISTYTRK